MSNYKMTDEEYELAYQKYVEVIGEEPKFVIVNEDKEEVELDPRTVIEDWFDGIYHLQELEESRAQYNPVEDIMTYNGKV